MTTPTPGFPPELETEIAEALAEHKSADDTCASCGFIEDAAAHQAAVVMGVIAQHTTTEWGFKWGGAGPSGVLVFDSEEEAREAIKPEGLVARLVLPWQEVKA